MIGEKASLKPLQYTVRHVEFMAETVSADLLHSALVVSTKSLLCMPA